MGYEEASDIRIATVPPKRTIVNARLHISQTSLVKHRRRRGASQGETLETKRGEKFENRLLGPTI
jgi:hypothetical protein